MGNLFKIESYFIIYIFSFIKNKFACYGFDFKHYIIVEIFNCVMVNENEFIGFSLYAPMKVFWLF